MDCRPGQGQRHDDHDITPSDEMESIQGDPIYSNDDGSTSGPGLKDVDSTKQIHEQSINLLLAFKHYYIYRYV